MKIITLLAGMLLMASPCFGQTPSPDNTAKIGAKTQRMTDIENKYQLKIVFIEVVHGEKFWMFLHGNQDGLFKVVPIMMRENAKDAEVKAAVMAASACSDFYDTELKSHFPQLFTEKENISIRYDCQ